MLLKIVVPVLFVLNFFIPSVNVLPHSDADCVQNVTGEIRDLDSKELLADVEVMLVDDSNKVAKTVKVEKDAAFSFEVMCNSNHIIKARKMGYNLQEKEIKTTKTKGKTVKLLIILGLNKE